MFVFWAAVFGLAVGSFLNSVIFRLEENDSALRGRSRCRLCREKIPWYYLAPVASFVYLRGRCHACRGRISFQYPLVEIATALIFAAFINSISPIGQINLIELVELIGKIGFWFALASIFIVLFVYDFKHQILPDVVLLPSLGFVFLADIFWGGAAGACSAFCLPGVFSALEAAGAAGGFFLFIFLISRGRWIGGGDVKLGALLGFILGWPLVLAALFSAFVAGGIIGVALIVLGRKKMDSAISFGPFLIGGAVMALFWGEILLDKFFYF